MIANAKPSSVVCTPSPPQAWPKSSHWAVVRRPPKSLIAKELSHDHVYRPERPHVPTIPFVMSSGAPYGCNVGRIDGKSMSADKGLVRNLSQAAKRSFHRHDLSRIHDAFRVERPLDRGHRGERRFAQLAGEIFHLALSDAVLPGAGAVHGQRPLDQPLAQGFCRLHLRRLGRVDQQGEVEISVPDVTK